MCPSGRIKHVPGGSPSNIRDVKFAFGIQNINLDFYQSDMLVIFYHMTQESTEYTVLTYIGVWVKTKINTS